MDTFRCARRSESVLGLRAGDDTWTMRDGYRHCSYCGSLHPEHLFEAIETGAQVTPTDKNYKIYVDMPDGRSGEMKITGMRNFPPAEGDSGWEKVTEENLPDVLAEGWSPNNLGGWMMKTPRGATLHDKFYFQHFSDAEIGKFIDLLNAKKVNLGHPGYFYVMPFFATRAKPADATV